MQASYAGPLASYNSLTDEHLSEYYSRPRTFRHLRRMGLVTKDGRIIDEGIIRVNNARKEQKARSKGILANSIVNKAIEFERKRRGDLKKKLELLEKYEIVEKVKSQKRHPPGIQEFNPYRSVPPPPPRLSTTLDMHFDQLSLSSDQIPDMRYLVGRISRGRTIPHPRAKSPYEEELASRFSSPVPHPPSTPRPHTAASVRGRRSVISSRPNTAPSGMRMGPRHGIQRPIPTRSQPVHSNVSITLKFIGTGLHLDSYSMESNTSDVMVVQQHCGGNTVPVYKGRVKPKDVITFVSKRHIGMPYGLTIYLDGMMDSRVSACCEYRHQCGKLLGSKTAHFKLVKVEGGKPCYRCEIERNKKYLQERQDREIKHVLEDTSLQELTPPQKTASRDEESHMIHDSPLRSSSEVFGRSTEHLKSQKSDTSAYQDVSQPDVHSDIAEKGSLASHSNVSVSSRASAYSKSSRVSVASSKSSVHSHMSTTSSKASSQSSKSSGRTASEHENPSPSCSSHSLREKESELPLSKISLSKKKDDTEPGETASVDEYNYDDDKFEEEEESKQPPLEEHSDNTGPTLSEENNVPRETTDADANYNYESDTFEEPNGVEEPPKQQSEKHHTEEKISLSPTLVERSTESDKTTTPVVLNQQLGSEGEAVGSSSDVEDNGQETQADSSHNVIEYDEDKLSGPQTDDTPATEQPGSDENALTEPEYEDTLVCVSVEEKVSVDPQTSASGEEPTMETKSTDATDTPDVEDNGQEILADSSHNVIEYDEDKLSGPQTDDTPATEQPGSDENAITEPEDEDTPVHVSVQESNKVSADPQTSASGEEPTIQTKSTDTPENQQEKHGILVTASKQKPTRLAVSFEANLQESSTVEDLSAFQTIEDPSNNMFQKLHSNASLGSDQESSLDLSGSDDTDKPDLEQKIADLIDESSNGGKMASRENMDTAVKVGENKEESPGEIASTDSQTRKLAADEKIPDLIDINRSGDKTLLQQNMDTATVVVDDENNSVEQERAGDSESVAATLQVGGLEHVPYLQLNVSDVSEDDSGRDKSGSQTAVMDQDKEVDTLEQPNQESTSKDKESSQEDAGELESISSNFESGGLEDKNGHTVVLRLSEEVPAEDEGHTDRLDNDKDTVDPDSDYSKDKTALQENVDTSAAVVEDVKENIEQLSHEMVGEGEDVPTNPQKQETDGDKGELEQTVPNLIDDVRKSEPQEIMDTVVIVAGSEKEDTSPNISVAENEEEGSPKLPDEGEGRNSHIEITNEAQEMKETVSVGQEHEASAGSQGDPEPTAASMPVEPSDHGSVASGLSLSSSKSSLTSVSSQASHS